MKIQDLLPCHRKQMSLLTVIFSILTLVLACAAPAATSSPSSTATPTAKPTATGPKYGGTLRLALRTPPTSMDTLVGNEPAGQALAKLYNACLVRWQGKEANEAKIVPWLAKSWEVSPDGLTITFKLNEGIKWQNIPPVNGREMVAEDFKYHFDRIVDPKNRFNIRSFFTNIDRVEAPDKYTLKFVNKSPDPGVFVNLCAGACAPIAREVIEKDGSGAKTFVGVGPFILKEYAASSRAVFEKNPDYFEKGKPYVDKVEVAFIGDDATQLAAFRSGQLDAFQAIKTVVDSAVKTVTGAQAIPGADARGVAVNMGIAKYPKPWGDVRVRQAVALAIDYEGVIAAAFDGAAYRTDFMGPLYKNLGARTGNDLPKRDIAKAKALLAEAGYPEIKTSIISNSQAVIVTATEPIVAMLKEIGISAEIKLMDTAEHTSQARSGDFQLSLNPSPADKPEPDIVLYPQFHSTGSANYGKYNNPKVDELLDLQRKDMGNVAKRNEDLKQIMTILQSEQPNVPVCVRYLYNLMQPYVKNYNNVYEGHIQFAFYDVVNVWLDK